MKGIEIRNLSKSYDGETVLEDVNLSFPSRGFFLILGESGSGKSTLFELLSGIDVRYEGRIVCFGRDFKRLSEKERGLYRLRNVGFLRQSFDLLPRESVLENATLPLSTERHKRKRDIIRARALLRDLGLKEKEKSLSFTLSGGEKQRLSLARALLPDPPLLLCDEPTGALDQESAKTLGDLLKKESKERLVIVSTHDANFFLPYADGVFGIKNKKIQCKKAFDFKKEMPERPIGGEKERFSPWRWLRHAFHLLNARKIRTCLSSVLLSFSFLGLGLSVFVDRNVGGKLEGAFEGLLGERAVTMSLKNQSAPSLGNVYCAPKESVVSISASLREETSLCASYLSPFEQIFKDQNSMSFKVGVRRYDVPSLSARSINDYCLLSDFPSRPLFPSKPSALEVDEVVFGFPKSEMVSLSRFFQVDPTFERVGSKIVKDRLPLLLSVENEDWGYYDEQAFFVAAVMEFEVPTLFHSDPLWNERIFEDRMRLPSCDGSSFETPWTLQKAYGIRGIREEEAFLKESREYPLSDYLFERDSTRFDSCYAERKERSASRYFVFVADRYALARDDIETALSLSCVSSHLPLPEGVYRSFPNALSCGFKEPFVLGKEERGALEIAEALSRVPKKAIASIPSLPTDVAAGSYLRPRSDSLSFSSDLGTLMKGREPQSIDEIVLSSSLYERLSRPEEVFVAGAISTSAEGDYYARDYRMASLKVVGVSSLPGDALLSSPYWLNDFFVIRLGMSSLLLEPRECLFYPKKGMEKRLLEDLSSRLSSYSVADPSAAIEESLTNTMGYLSATLSFASVSSLLSSFLLLLVLSSLYLLENKGEGRYLYLLGFSKSSIFDSYFSGIFLLLGSGFLSAIITLFAVEISFDEAISSSFGLPFSFVFDPYPHVVLLLSFVLSLLLLSIYLRFSLWRSDYSKRDAS